MIHAFGDCELDGERFELRRRGTPVKLERKVFDVVAYLVRHADRVVTKAELLDAVWPDVAVSESVLPKCIAAARRAVGDTRQRPAVIQTVHGRGYRLIAPVETRAPADGVPPPSEPDDAGFVGRAPVLARLRRRLEDALGGRGHVVVLVGEPGIGKTRTAEHVGAEAARRGAAVLVGRAYDGEATPAFWPWVQILRACAALPDETAWRDGALAPEVAALVPELAAPAVAPAAPSAPETRFRLFDGIATVLKRAATRRPLVLVLDDVHWADAGSLHLLRLIATEVAGSRLLVIATCRDHESERQAAVAEVLGVLAREPHCEWITLAGLDADATHDLVVHITAGTPSRALSATVHAMTEGNPFFVHEVTRLLADADDPADTDAHDREPTLASRALPRRLRDAIRRRLGTLSAECRALLGVAAVLGREIEVGLLAAVAEQPVDTVLRLLAEARAARVVDAADDGVGRWVFHHVLTRQALYEDLDEPARVRWHARAGARLAALGGADPDAYCDALAYHCFAAAPGGDAARAVLACTRAAERAHRLLAYERAAVLYERALTALALAPPVDEVHRVELLLGVGETRAAAGARAAAREAFGRAAAIARELGRGDLLARAALGYRGPAEMGVPGDPESVALLEEALDAVADRHPVLRARLLGRLVGTSPRSDVMATRRRLADEAYVLASASGDPTALRDALSARLWAALGPDHVATRLAVADELRALGERTGSLPLVLLSHDAELGAQLLRGAMPAAKRALAAYARTADALKQPAFLFLATFWEASLAMAEGRLAEAAGLFRGASERGRGTVPFAHFMYAGQMYPLVYLRGDADDPELDRIFFGEMIDLPYAFEPAVRSALAFALWLRGDAPAARAELERVTAQLPALPRDEHWLVTAGGLGRVAVVLDDAERAAALHALLLPYVDLVVVHDMLRAIGEPVASVLAHLETLLGRFAEAAGHYEQAIALTTRMGTRLSALDGRAGQIRLLEMRRGPGDAERATALRGELGAEMAALGVRRNWLLDAPPTAP